MTKGCVGKIVYVSKRSWCLAFMLNPAYNQIRYITFMGRPGYNEQSCFSAGISVIGIKTEKKLVITNTTKKEHISFFFFMQCLTLSETMRALLICQLPSNVQITKSRHYLNIELKSQKYCNQIKTAGILTKQLKIHWCVKKSLTEFKYTYMISKYVFT